MKTIASLSILCLMMIVCAACKSDVRVGVVGDNIFNFNNAFLLEPTCSGLVRDDGNDHQWTVRYDTSFSEHPTVDVFHNDLFVTTVFATDPQDAARKVCFIIKGRGGKVHANAAKPVRVSDGSNSDAVKPFNSNDYPEAKEDAGGKADDDCYDLHGNLMPSMFTAFGGSLIACGAGETRKARSERANVPPDRRAWVEQWEACDKAVIQSGHATKEAFDACRTAQPAPKPKR